MNRILHNGTPFIAMLASLLWVTVARSADDVPTPNDEVAKLVEQITLNDGVIRRQATDKLIKIGLPAVLPLSKAAETDDAAAIKRCFDALGRLLVSDDEKTAKATQESLEKLSDSDIRIVAVRAKTTLIMKEVLRNREGLLKAAPAAADFPGPAVSRLMATENGKTIQLEKGADGSFTGKITETVDGKKKETEIKSASEKELEEKFPDAHKAYQKQQRQPQPLGVPAPLPVLPQPGLLQFNVQLNGAGRQTTTVRIINGKRQIEAQNGDEKVQINDTNGLDIVLKHTRMVDGKEKTDEYKATDLDDLNKKHPEAAKLYGKYANNNLNIRGGGGVPIQVQIGAPGGVQGFRGQLRPDQFGADVVPNQPAGPRTIRAEQEGRKIEITDEDGKKIRVKLTKLVDGKEVSQEFSADDLKSLKSEHPEAAKLYEQFTGRKVE